MNTKMSRRQKDIKSKLMAAIAMLLVSSIMMVSTTYAWFTLSTAPEVKGITTAVGANGNLEMALMPLDGQVSSIKSGEADSMDAPSQTKTAANITWGNLVDVSLDYGLENVILYPSALNFQDEAKTKINLVFPVSIPVYGADGRISSLAANKAVTGVYAAVNENEKAFLDTVDIGNGQTGTGYGVRAIGTQSNASPALLAYKAAITSASGSAGEAIAKARNILQAKGGVLADLAIRKMDATDDAEIYTDDDKANLQAMLAAILGTYDAEGKESSKGSLLIIRDAMKEYMIAYHIATTAEYASGVETIRSMTTLDPASTFVPDAMKPIVTKLVDAINNAKTAQSALNNLTDGAYSWSDLSAVVNPIANPAFMTLNGIKINELMTEESIEKLMDDVLGQKGFTLALTSGAGVFVDIADFCGNYSAQVIIPKIKHDKIPGSGEITDLEATMTTNSTVSPTYLSQAQTAAQATGGPSTDGSDTEQPITDFYGYIIDLAFKTNVAGSTLNLQTTAVDRIYAGNDKNVDTMGGGSSMIFTTSDSEFMPDEMFALLKHMKVVLFDRETGKIYKYLTIPAKIEDAIVNGTSGINVPLYVADASGTLPALKADSDDFDNTITALDQNVAKQISVLVYLDGKNITNKDIASAVQSMSGSLNLQFCSSEELTPMEYYDLRNGVDSSGTSTGGGTTSEIIPTDNVTINDTYEITEARFVTTDGVHGIAVGIKDVTDAGYTVTIDGEDATYGHNVWLASTSASAVPDSVTVVVTPKQ